MRKIKKKFIDKNDRLASLARLDENYEPRFYASTIGYVKNGRFYDKFNKENKNLKIYMDVDALSTAIKEGNVDINEVYCYSIYRYENEFPLLSTFHNQQEAEDYLRSYNQKQDVSLVWSFMDEDEVKEIDKKAQKSISRYYY